MLIYNIQNLHLVQIKQESLLFSLLLYRISMLQAITKLKFYLLLLLIGYIHKPFITNDINIEKRL